MTLLLLLSGLLLGNLVACFHISPSPLLPCNARRTTTFTAPESPTSLKSTIADGNDFVSPNQLKALRKEASRRRARKSLARHSLPSDESHGPFSKDTLSAVADKLAKNELVEVRSISRDRKQTVFDVTEQLAIDVGIETGKLITVVERKGFSAVLYCPGDADLDGKITLRTSYREGQWTRKPRPKRDDRGQIIKGEFEYFD